MVCKIIRQISDKGENCKHHHGAVAARGVCGHRSISVTRPERQVCVCVCLQHESVVSGGEEEPVIDLRKPNTHHTHIASRLLDGFIFCGSRTTSGAAGAARIRKKKL